MTTKFKHDHWTKGVTERVNHLRDTFWKFEPSVDIERSVIYTRTYKETEAEDTIIRRATSFKNYMNERTIDFYRRTDRREKPESTETFHLLP